MPPSAPVALAHGHPVQIVAVLQSGVQGVFFGGYQLDVCTLVENSKRMTCNPLLLEGPFSGLILFCVS